MWYHDYCITLFIRKVARITVLAHTFSPLVFRCNGHVPEYLIVVTTYIMYFLWIDLEFLSTHTAICVCVWVGEFLWEGAEIFVNRTLSRQFTLRCQPNLVYIPSKSTAIIQILWMLILSPLFIESKFTCFLSSRYDVVCIEIRTQPTENIFTMLYILN